MKRLTLAFAALAIAAATVPAEAKEYILAMTKPSSLHLVDVEARAVVQSCTVPGRGGFISITPSPDGQVAYVTTNGWGEVYGIHIDSCDVVFHAVLSQGNVRARSIAGLAISNDGSELYVQMSEVALLPDRYEIRDPHRIAVFRTDAGMDAMPYRSFDIPRGHTVLVPSNDGKTAWSPGAELRQFDLATGEIKQEILLNSWEDAKPTYGDPDGLAFWPLYETSNVLIMPYFAPIFANREARDAGDWDQLADFVVGYSRVDLSDNSWTQVDITTADVLIFSFAEDPRDANVMYGVYTQLTKYDVAAGEIIKRVDLEHTYYSVITSASGEELYIGSTFNDLAIYSSETLEQLAKIELPGGDQGAVGIRYLTR
jgi:quinohemoprotein amine dehydrogenase beta subunit